MRSLVLDTVASALTVFFSMSGISRLHARRHASKSTDPSQTVVRYMH